MKKRKSRSTGMMPDNSDDGENGASAAAGSCALAVDAHFETDGAAGEDGHGDPDDVIAVGEYRSV